MKNNKHTVSQHIKNENNVNNDNSSNILKYSKKGSNLILSVEKRSSSVDFNTK